VTLQDVFGAALMQTVGVPARVRGFRRARRVWRRVSERQDWAAFEVQSSQWNSAESIHCVVNVGAAPAPWLEFSHARNGGRAKTFSPASGIFWTRLGPGSADDDVWWEIRDESDAAVVASEIGNRMTKTGFPLLAELLDRRLLTQRIRDGQMGEISEPNPVWLAVLLAEEGPSRELDEALEKASNVLDADAYAFANSWCKERAHAVG
jgi:hypothetical protein